MVASPIVSTEGILGSFMIDAYKGREVVGSFHIPGVYLHTDMKHDGQTVFLSLCDEFVEMMCKANPKYISPYIMSIINYEF